MTLEGLPVTRSELMVQMRTLTAARPGLRVRVSADRSMPYQRVVELTEALRTAGVQNIALNTQR
jgi:biopolymer transport protein ExbD